VKVSFGICVYEDAERVLAGLRNCLIPSLELAAEAEILCLDNSAVPSPTLREALAATGVSFRYEWNEGKNLRYAATLNRMVELARFPNFVYVCLAHSEMRDPSWWQDLVTALEDPRHAMAGALQPGPWEFPVDHIQGGVFAARTETLRAFPFSSRYPHDYSDIGQSEALRRAGLALASVKSIAAMHQGMAAPPDTDWKLLHRSRPRSRSQKFARWVKYRLMARPG
jgi:hypothetical protein